MAENFTIPNPRQILMGDSPIAASQSTLATQKEDYVLDRDWAKRAFLMNDIDIGDKDDVKNRYWSTASFKFTDTRLGANIGVNARPQFTWYSDTRIRGRLMNRQEVGLQNTGGNYGMGHYYSEAIDDNAQTIYMRFGVPQFNSLVDFFSNAFDKDWVTMARTGRGKSIWYSAGVVAGTILSVSAAPGLAAAIIGGKILGMFFTRPTSKFYTLKPTMHVYWSAVNMLVNAIAINRGIIPRIMKNTQAQRIGGEYMIDPDTLTQLHELMPDVFTDDGGIDVFAFANKGQRLANQLFHDDYEALDKGSATDYVGYVKKEGGADDRHPSYISDKTGSPTLGAWINKLLEFGYYKADDAKTKIEANIKIDPETGKKIDDPSVFEKTLSYFDAEFRQGSQFAIFKVDHTGSVSESFSNSAVESELSQKFNSTSSQMREARFSFADGNLSSDVLTQMATSVVGALGDMASGAISGATFGLSDALMGLGGSGFIDIPKHWQSSSASLPRASYTMQLISPYGNAISQMQNIYIPLAMILASVLPLSTGKQSYTSPFLVQLFDRGRCQIQLGMVESVSITRGTSNLAFTRLGVPLAIDVSFSVMDLSSIMHMPMSSGSLFGANMAMDEDNTLKDYLAVLAGQDMYTQIYPLEKAKLNLARMIRSTDKLTSPAYWMSLFHESATSGTMSYLTLGAFNALEGLVRGSGMVTGGVQSPTSIGGS